MIQIDKKFFHQMKLDFYSNTWKVPVEKDLSSDVKKVIKQVYYTVFREILYFYIWGFFFEKDERACSFIK